MWLADPLLVVPWMLFIGLFPDGHRPCAAGRSWSGRGAVLVTVVSTLAWLTRPMGAATTQARATCPRRRASTSTAAWTAQCTDSAQIASALTGLFPLVAAWCLLHRYRRAGPVMRQQIRVGAAGLITCVVIEVGLRTLPFVDGRPVQFVAAVIAVGVGALGVAAGLLRWRLWIVDQALPRAVVLGTCSAAFTALIAAGALIVTGRVEDLAGPGGAPGGDHRYRARAGLQPAAGALGQATRLRRPARGVRRADRAGRRPGDPGRAAGDCSHRRCGSARPRSALGGVLDPDRTGKGSSGSPRAAGSCWPRQKWCTWHLVPHRSPPRPQQTPASRHRPAPGSSRPATWSPPFRWTRRP